MNTPMTNNSGPEPSHRGGRRPVDNPPKPTPRLPDPFVRPSTGRIIYTPPIQHDCAPSLEAPEGSIWKCDHCGSEWMAVDHKLRTQWLIMERHHDHNLPNLRPTYIALTALCLLILVGVGVLLTSG